MAIRHGAYSVRMVTAKAEEIRAALLEEWPLLSRADPFTIDQYCWHHARAQMLNDYVLTFVKAYGVEALPKTVWGETSRAESSASRWAVALGIVSPERTEPWPASTAECDELQPRADLIRSSRVTSDPGPT